jgi:hypothetical protein
MQKCPNVHLVKRTLKYLGDNISEGVKVDPSKIKEIINWP